MCEEIPKPCSGLSCIDDNNNIYGTLSEHSYMYLFKKVLTPRCHNT